jgi:hypothetical protein
MLCALTVRKLKPGTFEEFRSNFWTAEQPPPGNWTEFSMLRNIDDESEVVTFGFFDGTREELERSQDEQGYSDRVASVEPLVESVVAGGIYDFEVAVETASGRE